MYKSTQSTQLLNSDNDVNENQTLVKAKTTNVNILLNRVRLDRKEVLKKKIIFIFLLFSIVGLVTVFAIV
jgi:hypothetical protein|tara:strand:- start:599 stop:808 length:210 start_codon:yes stop_codon:yes gene_type:complete